MNDDMKRSRELWDLSTDLSDLPDDEFRSEMMDMLHTLRLALDQRETKRRTPWFGYVLRDMLMNCWCMAFHWRVDE